LAADFGKTASDYGRHRAGFPDELRAMPAERWPEDPMRVMHRMCAAIGVAP
jgi:hypothetical protein